MTIKVGDPVPDGVLYESIGYNDQNHCPVAPGEVKIGEQLGNKRVVVFGLPGAFTMTCSGKHLPGFVSSFEKFKAKGVDELWCVSVNDGYVMAAWGLDQKVGNKIRMLGDGNALWTRALGVENDRTSAGMGMRMRRFSMLVEDGVVKQLNLEAPGKFEVSDAETLLKQIG